MKNKFFMIIFFLMFSFLILPEDVDALTVSQYKSRNVCSNYEVAEAKTDGSAVYKKCFTTYSEAETYMNSSSITNLIIFDSTATNTVIASAKYALVDLTIPSGLTYFYEQRDLTTRVYTYMDTGSLYGGVDGAFIDVYYPKSAKVMIGGLEAWIKKSDYEIVPLAWVKSSSSYTVTDHIKHNYVSKIQETYSGTKGSTIGPKPDQLNKGTYYSYDGHYFYTSRYTMISDYKKGVRTSSVNKSSPYYNYYMYLSNHSKTNYSSLNIDEYIRNNMGLTRTTYGELATSNSSKLYGQGTFFYNSQQVYGVNAVLSLSLSRNETGNGRSSLAINNNNGFGLNAVDSSPTESAYWYPSFASSINGYASKWVTDGYADPADWRYFGPAFGDKYIGMNVKYASDTYWSEKMAANYYSLDLAKGLQDYNYYQLGKTNGVVKAYLSASTSSKIMYTYPEKDDNVLIVGEYGNYYILQSDVSITNGVGSTNGVYNWNSYVYVLKSSITKINTAKSGYKKPSEVYQYADATYTYDLMDDNTTLSPKVAVTTKNLSYYYDSTLSQKTGKTLLSNKYIMVYSIAKNSKGEAVAYLVTSDYKFDQKHWIPAGGITFKTSSYGKVKLTNLDGYFTEVYSTASTSSTMIGGQFSYSYVPILETKTVSGKTWYKVPVSLTSTSNAYGWTLKSYTNVAITPYSYNGTADNNALAKNTAPVITASNKEVTIKKSLDLMKDVSATDKEDGNLTTSIKITSNNINYNAIGTYSVTYSVTDLDNLTTTKTISVKVIADEAPVINASNQNVITNSEFNPLIGVTATDKEDGTITKVEVTSNNVDVTTNGNYSVTYKVVDSYGNITTKTIAVVVAEKFLTEKDSLFYFDYLKEVDGKLELKGYQTINGIDHLLNTNIDYTIIFENKDTNEIFTDTMTRITNTTEMTRPIFGVDNKNYTYSWFKYSIDTSKFENGNYIMYVLAESDEYYTKNLVNNKLFRPQVGGYTTASSSTIIRNDYNVKTTPVELIIRGEELAKKTADTYFNQFDTYRAFEFTEDNKLHLMGLSYSYGMDLGKDTNVERTIIFENKETYETYKMDLGSITTGLYPAMLPEDDKLSKTRAWYDKELDISNIPKGEYILYITTKSNVTDIYEFSEKLSRTLDHVKATINEKNYSFTINHDKGSRIEMKVE